MTKRGQTKKSDLFRAFKWADVNRERLPDLTLRQAADLMAKDLGCVITRHTVTTIYAELQIEPAVPKSKRRKGDQTHYSRANSQKITTLAKVVAELFQRLGEELPAPLTRLLAGIKPAPDAAQQEVATATQNPPTPAAPAGPITTTPATVPANPTRPAVLATIGQGGRVADYGGRRR